MNNDKKNILIVEDDEALQKLIIEKLAGNGILTACVRTAQEALTKIKEKIPDLILLDIMLPGGMNGFDLLEQIRKNPILKKIPVIVLTNLDTERKTAMEIGAVDYIVKTNISLDELILKIKNNLRL